MHPERTIPYQMDPWLLVVARLGRTKDIRPPPSIVQRMEALKDLDRPADIALIFP